MCVRFQRHEITDGFQTSKRENFDENLQGEFYDNHAYIKDGDSSYDTSEEVDLNKAVDTVQKTNSSSMDGPIKLEKHSYDAKVCSILSKVPSIVNFTK